MSKISLIVAIDEHRGIGFQNALLCHLPADLKHFKAVTLGKPIIMGYRTFVSIGRPLPGRLNIVLTRQERQIEGIQIAHTLKQALSFSSSADEVMIIGGANVFEESLSLADRIYLTKIHHHFQADVFFPELNSSEWCAHVLGEHARDEKNAYDMTFYIFERISGSS